MTATHESSPVTLLECLPGQPCRIVVLQGGSHFRLRLKNLGLVEGKIITKVHAHPFRGPVTIKVHNSQVAIGHGMANHILVEPVDIA